MNKDYFKKILKLPVIHFHPSLYCNLKCKYCTQADVRQDKLENNHNLYRDKNFLKFLSTIKQSHLYISGGEPLIQKDLTYFLEYISKTDHKVSFDTNGTIDPNGLERIIKNFDFNIWGFFNITHHILSGVSFHKIEEVCDVLKSNKIPHFVKYIATPDEINIVYEYMSILKNKNIGVAITPLETYERAWNKRFFPVDYTTEELRQLLSMVTLYIHGLQFFGGLKLKGHLCYCGNYFVVYNMKGKLELIPCCHSQRNVFWNNTYFITGEKKLNKCEVESCHGDLMYILGVQKIFNELDRFTNLCFGKPECIGLHSMLDFLKRLNEQYKFKYNKNFKNFWNKLEE